MAASAVCHSARLLAQMATSSPGAMPSWMRKEAIRRVPSPNWPQVIEIHRSPDLVYRAGRSARPRIWESRYSTSVRVSPLGAGAPDATAAWLVIGGQNDTTFRPRSQWAAGRLSRQTSLVKEIDCGRGHLADNPPGPGEPLAEGQADGGAVDHQPRPPDLHGRRCRG